MSRPTAQLLKNKGGKFSKTLRASPLARQLNFPDQIRLEEITFVVTVQTAAGDTIGKEG